MAKKNRPIEQEQEADQLKSTPSKPSARKAAAPQSDNEPDSDSSCSSPSLSAFEVKPIAMQTAPRKKETPSPPKEKKSDDGKGRWSFKDEIALLDAVIQYKSQIGPDPWSNWAAFLDYIEKSGSLQVKIPTKDSLAKKVRKFKKDYLSIVKRNEGESENQAPVFSDPDERDLFHLCDKIWGSGEDQDCSLKKDNPPKKVNLGPRLDENPAKKSRGSEVAKEKEKETRVVVEEDKRKGTVKKSNSGIILGLPIEEPPAKKRRRSEAKKQKETRVVMKDDENDSEKEKGREKEAVLVMVEENGVNEDDDDDGEKENDANEDEDEDKGKNDVNDDVEDKENDANEDDDAEEKGKEKGKGKETDVVMEKHELWQKYPRVFASMVVRLAFMDKAHGGNVSDLRQVCKEIIEKADEEKLKDWESRWQKQMKVELEALVGRKTLEIEESTEWLDILQR